MEITLYVFMIIAYGLGNAFAETYKMGYIFPSDIPLAVLAVFLFIYQFSVHQMTVKKITFFAISFMVFEFLQGIAVGASFAYIFRDLKIWLYFFVPYWSIKYLLQSDDKSAKRIKICFFITIIMTLVQNWQFFITNGLSGLEYSSLTRSFDYGMNFSIAILLLLCAMAEKKWVCSKISIVGYYAVEVICLLSIIVSYTRSFWIMLVLAFIAYYALLKINKINSNFNLTTIIAVVVTIIGVAFIIYYGRKNFPEVYNAIVTRFSSIFVHDTSGVNQDTLSGRLEYMKDTLSKFYSPRILFGYGYGDTQTVSSQFLTFRSAESWNCENSILYYCWKYGIIAACYLFFTALHRVLNCIHSSNRLRIALISYLIAWIPVGLMSGNFNSSFTISTFAALFAFVQYGFSEDESQLADVNNFEEIEL